MGKYRKKPVVVEAEQWFPYLEMKAVVYPVYSGPWEVPWHDVHGDDCGLLDTLEEGFMVVTAGDWIVTGVAGERYPVKPDVFEQTYEPV